MNEEREREELGEIPEDLMTERGEGFPNQAFIPPNTPADIASSAPLGDAPTVLGDRTQGANVRSTFDTRPINGTDFYHTDIQTVTPSNEDTETVDFQYTVPKGYVAVLRQFEFWNNPFVPYPGADMYWAIFVDGIAQTGHGTKITLQNMGPYPTHIIAKENSVITLRLLFETGFSSGVALSIFFRFYGNLLLSQNVPLAFEIGNQEPSKAIPLPELLGGETVTPKKVMPPKTLVKQPKTTAKKLPRFYKSGSQSGSSGRLNLPIKRR